MSISRRLSLSLVLVALLTAVALDLVMVVGIRGVLTPVEEERDLALVQRKAAELHAYLQHVGADALALAQALPNNRLAQEISSPNGLSPSSLTDIQRRFLARLNTVANYLQVRLIAADAPGMELVRVQRERFAEPGEVVAYEALQAKGQRDYQQSSLRLSEGEIFISPIELNREHGQVVIPEVPVMRAGTPLRDAQGRVFASIVINVDMRRILRQLAASDGPGKTYLISQQGEFLLHPQAEGLFPNDSTPGFTWSSQFPDLPWVSSHSEPWQQVTRDAAGESIRLTGVPVRLSADRVVFLLAATAQLSEQTINTVNRLVLSATLLAMLLAMVFAGWMARTLTQPLDAIVRAARHLNQSKQLQWPVSAIGELGYLSQVLQDTDLRLRKHSKQLVAQRQRFETLFHASPSALVLVDQAQTIELANQQACQLFGYRENELHGLPIHRLVPEAMRQAHQDYVRQYLLAPEQRAMAKDVQLVGVRKDGVQVPVVVGLNPLQTDKGTQILAAIEDISERMKFEQQLRRSNEELSRFAYVAAHDLREPIRIVTSYAQMLERRYREQLDDKAERYIDYIVSESGRMQNMISDLLTYSRLESQGQPPQAVDLQVVMDSVVETLQPSIEAIDATLEVAPLPSVLADASQMRMLLHNLLTNAINYRSAEPLCISVSATRQGEWQVIAVADNGQGIAPKHFDEVFQLFRRLQPKGEGEGSGIGLALVKRIVERHSGRVWLESAEGVGSTFYFSLPAVAEAVPSAE